MHTTQYSFCVSLNCNRKMILPLFIAFAAITLFSFISMNFKLRANKKHPSGPKGLPFIGNLHQFDKTKPHIYLWELSNKYGPLAYIKHGCTDVLVVNSTEMATRILKTHDVSFCSRPPVVGQQKLAYNGLDMAFSPHNEHWKNMRKISILHLLSPKQVLDFRPIREDEVSRMIQKIKKLSSLSQTINLSGIAMSIASNFICRVAFGRRYDDDEYEKIRFDKLILEAQALMVTPYFTDHFPAFAWLDTLSGVLNRLDNNCKELDRFYQELIDEHLNPSRPKPERQDILDLMIQLKDLQDSSSLNVTWEHIKALLMDLFVAGTDTVAAAMVWTMTALIKNPEIMNKAQAEIRKFVNEKGVVEEDDIRNLPYLKAVVMESLRMYPPAPLLYRTQISQKPCFIDQYEVRPGTEVIINGWALARDPQTWKNPDEFLPERFTSAENTIERFNMIPFGGGRRGCPGMGMGLISVELAIANLLYAFDWTFPNGMSIHDIDTDALPGLTMHKKNALVLVASVHQT